MTTGSKFFVDYHLTSGRYVRQYANPSAKSQESVMSHIEKIVKPGNGVVRIPDSFIFLDQVTHITIHNAEAK